MGLVAGTLMRIAGVCFVGGRFVGRVWFVTRGVGVFADGGFGGALVCLDCDMIGCVDVQGWFSVRSIVSV